MAPSEVANWVRAARRGDPEAGEKIYLYLREHLLPQIRRHTPLSMDPEDVFEETILTVFKHLRQLRDDEGLLSYAAQVARHLLARRERSLPVEVGREVAGTDLSLRNIEADELLAGLVASLDANALRLFRMIYVDGLSNHEAAKRLGLPLGILHHRKHNLNLNLRLRVLRSLRGWQPGAQGPMCL